MTRLMDVYNRLFAAYGPQHWWPAETPFEVMVGAVLVQNTAWRNVERAIEALKARDLLQPRALYALDLGKLETLIRPSGYYRIKARRLYNLAAFTVETYEGDLRRMFSIDPHVLREQLLGVSGIGPETADSILLYAGGLPSFVVDAYTYRILTRHGLIGREADYAAMQALFRTTLPRDAALYNEFHALLVRVGKECCSKRCPNCTTCPLAPLLPDPAVA